MRDESLACAAERTWCAMIRLMGMRVGAVSVGAASRRVVAVADGLPAAPIDRAAATVRAAVPGLRLASAMGAVEAGLRDQLTRLSCACTTWAQDADTAVARYDESDAAAADKLRAGGLG